MAVAAITCLMVVTASASAHRLRHGPVPRAGDWEATAGQASFTVSEVRKHGKLSIEVVDPTFVLTRHCKGGGTGAGPVGRPNIKVSPRGSFTYRKFRNSPGIGETLETMSGRFRSGTLVIVRVREQVDITLLGVSDNCDTGTVGFHMRPATRTAIPDGIYTGTAANGEPVQVRVIQGGRMIGGDVRASGPDIPSVQVGTFTTTCSSPGTCTSTPNNSDACARQLADLIWIDSSGQFDLAPPDSTDPGVTGSFSAGELSGTLGYSGDDASCSTSFTARL